MSLQLQLANCNYFVFFLSLSFLFFNFLSSISFNHGTDSNCTWISRTNRKWKKKGKEVTKLVSFNHFKCAKSGKKRKSEKKKRNSVTFKLTVTGTQDGLNLTQTNFFVLPAINSFKVSIITPTHSASHKVVEVVTLWLPK